MTINRPVLFGVLALTALTLVGSTTVLAACSGVAVTACNTTCTSDCFLLNDLSCTANTGVTLNNGADLDLCGHSIRCTSAYCTGNGVTMSGGSANIVKNTLGDAPDNIESKISGPWYAGVDCGFRSGSRVTGIHIDGTASFGTFNCAKVDENVITLITHIGTFPLFGIGISNSSGVAATDYITDNYIRAPKGIYSATTKTLSIDHNMIVMADPEGDTCDSPNYCYGIDTSVSSSAITTASNVILGIVTNAFPILAPEPAGLYGATFSQNYCEPSTYECGYSTSAGFTRNAVAPFTLP